MTVDRAPDDFIGTSVGSNWVRFVLGLVLVTAGAGAFAVAFRASLAALYQTLYGADNIVDSKQRSFGLELYAELLSFAALGIAAAVVALAFKAVLAVLERWFETHPVPQPFGATAASKALGDQSVYETELRKRGLGWEMTLEGRQLKNSSNE